MNHVVVDVNPIVRNVIYIKSETLINVNMSVRIQYNTVYAEEIICFES